MRGLVGAAPRRRRAARFVMAVDAAFHNAALYDAAFDNAALDTVAVETADDVVANDTERAGLRGRVRDVDERRRGRGRGWLRGVRRCLACRLAPRLRPWPDPSALQDG